MCKNYIIIFLLFFILGCSNDDFNNMPQEELKKSNNASSAFGLATSMVRNDDPAGFLKLYEIAKDDDTYTAEYSEVAHDEILLLLYSKTDLWIKTFSQINQKEFLLYLNQRGLGMSTLPKGVKSEKEAYKKILKNLNKIKANKKEIELIDFVKKYLEDLLE